jgi:hypothetical protein
VCNTAFTNRLRKTKGDYSCLIRFVPDERNMSQDLSPTLTANLRKYTSIFAFLLATQQIWQYLHSSFPLRHELLTQILYRSHQWKAKLEENTTLRHWKYLFPNHDFFKWDTKCYHTTFIWKRNGILCKRNWNHGFHEILVIITETAETNNWVKWFIKLLISLRGQTVLGFWAFNDFEMIWVLINILE